MHVSLINLLTGLMVGGQKPGDGHAGLLARSKTIDING